MSKAPPTPPSDSDADRKARQADALRRNLARRKQQARDRAAQGGSAPRDGTESAGAGDEG